MRQRLLVFLLAILYANSHTELKGQSEQTTLEVLRGQALTLADSAIGKLPSPEDSAIVINVEGGGFKSLLENAILNRLSASGRKGRLSADEGLRLPELSILLLENDAVLEPLGSGRYRRACVTRFEARYESANRTEATYLGLFEERRADTAVVSQSEIDALSVLRGGVGDAPDFFEGFLSPVLIILSTVIIVYLFFTVRS